MIPIFNKPLHNKYLSLRSSDQVNVVCLQFWIQLSLELPFTEKTVNVFCYACPFIFGTMNGTLKQIFNLFQRLLCYIFICSVLLTTTMATNINRYRGIKCYDCERIMVYCVFRCSMQPTYVKWYYCSDFCDRRNLTCVKNCRRD